MELFWLLLGLWRCWLGGGIGKDWPAHSRTAVQLLSGMVLVAIATWSAPWDLTLIHAIAIVAVARIYGHGPMLQVPLKPDPDGDLIYELATNVRSPELRWWAYAWIRYGLLGVVWGIAAAVDGGHFAGPVLATWAIMIAYRLSWACRDMLPKMTTPGDETQNWAELVGWSAAGALMMVYG